MRSLILPSRDQRPCRPWAFVVTTVSNRLRAFIQLAFLAVFANTVSFAGDDASRPITPYIVGGKDAPAEAYPWMVALIRENGASDFKEGQFCGGFLIDPEWLITAAHCVDSLDPNDFIIGYGDSNLDRITRTTQPAVILPHPAYSFRTSRGADVALIQLAEPITDIEPLKLNEDSEYARALTQARIIGWGGTDFDYNLAEYPSQLQEADIAVLTLAHVNQPSMLDGDAHSDFIPAGTASPPKGTFAGDSGSPLVTQNESGEWVAIGVTSHGFGSCGSPYDHLSFFTDLALFKAWIHECVTARPWQPTEAEIADGLQSKPFVDWDTATGSPILFSRVWPFAESWRLQVEVAHNYNGWYLPWRDYRHDQADLSLIGGHWYLRQPFQRSYLPSSMIVQRIEHAKDSSVRNRFYPLQPFGSIRINGASTQWQWASPQVNIMLSEMKTGADYRIVGSNAESLYALEKRDVSHLQPIDSSFVAQSDTNYIARFQAQLGGDISLNLIGGNPTSLTVNSTLSGSLNSESLPYRRPGFHSASYSFHSYLYNEAVITVSSDFDAEIQVIRRENGQRIAYYDSEAQNATERLIVGGQGLSESEILITNYSKNDLGNFSIRVASHSSSSSVSRPSSTTRAITATDRSFVHDDGVTQYFEQLQLTNLIVGQRAYISIRGINNFDPPFALFTSHGDLVVAAEQQRCSSINEISFVPESGKRYELVVAVFDERELNGNYELTLGSTSRTLSDPIPQPSPKSAADRLRSHRHHSMDANELHLRLIEAFLESPGSQVAKTH